MYGKHPAPTHHPSQVATHHPACLNCKRIRGAAHRLVAEPHRLRRGISAGCGGGSNLLPPHCRRSRRPGRPLRQAGQRRPRPSYGWADRFSSRCVEMIGARAISRWRPTSVRTAGPVRCGAAAPLVGACEARHPAVRLASGILLFHDGPALAANILAKRNAGQPRNARKGNDENLCRVCT
jgi:hypothetical protein